MTDKQYTLTVTETQAQVLIQALEVMARLGIGQFRDALDLLPMQEFRPPGWHEDMEAIGRILSKHTIGGVEGHRISLGISHADTSPQAKSAWDMYQVIRHRLSWDRAVWDGTIDSPDAPRDWSKMLGVHYDEPMRTGPEPLAKIERVEKVWRKRAKDVAP